ncbi:Calx-beta domain protein [Gimesia maris]|nr:Calx-beta domain protein [Gimesia maris]
MVVGRPSFVSSFRRSISLLNCLRRGQRKRQSRDKIKNYASCYSTAEKLEDRTLLAGASLVNIEPNIDLSLTDGEVYNEAPQELTFVFSPGQEIDPTSLGGIQIVRSGLDGTFADGNEVTIEPGYVGIGDNPNEVIVRFASALPDDHYQITIFGTGADPLLNLTGDAFRDFTEDGTQNGEDQIINFELDLGAKVVAVVSQPVLREQILSVGDVTDLQDGDTFTISVGGAVVTFEMDLDGSGLNDTNNLQVAYSAADSASDIATTILGVFNGSLLATDGYATISPSGADLTIAGDSFTPAISFSLVDPANPAFSRADGDLVARDDQILVYFNDDDLNPDLANDSRFYQIIDTSTDPPLLTTDYTATYDPLSDVTVLKLSTSLDAGHQYRLRVGVSDTPDNAENTYSTIGFDSETISILAGGGATSTPISGVTTIADLNLNDPSSLVVDGSGDYYFVHNDSGTRRILKVNHQTGIITVIAGNGSTAPANGIFASDLQLSPSGPRDIVLDANGNLYFTDGAHILKIDAISQLVTVIAGGGFDDTPDTGDVPTDLLLDTPDQLTIDSEGNISFHDSGAGQLILIDGHSGLVLAGVSTQFGTSPFSFSLDITDLEVDPVGNLFILTPGFPPILSFPGLDEGIYYIDFHSGHSVFHGGSSFDLNFDPADPTDLLNPVAGGGSTPLANGVLATDLNLSTATEFTFDANGYLIYADSAGYIVRLNPYADPAERLVDIIAGGGGTSVSTSGVVATEAQLGVLTSVAIGTGNTPYFFDSTNDQLLSVENIPDKNSSFVTATTLNPTANDATEDVPIAWNPGAEEFVITSQIQPQGIGLPPLPGGNDEPGHRQLPATLDAHIGSVGTNPVTAGSVSVVYYNFRDAYGTDVQGNQLHNAITEEQKQRTREIFEIYAYYLGIEFVESANQGITVVTGDLRVADPGLPVGPGGVGGVSTGPMVIMDYSDYTNPSDDVYGGSWMGTAFHEIGHSLGLGHALDIPSVMGDSLPQAGGQTVYPGDYDITHLLRLYRTDANDIDLYEFNLAESGTFRAEVFAERLQNSSLLNSVLTLFDEDHNVIARNDDYFSNDSFLELNLAAGTYFIGVTSTGNDNYNPEIENSGDNGSTDGLYELRLNFAADPVIDLNTPSNSEILLDTDGTGTAFDGDSDGIPGGAYDFFFVASDSTNTIYIDKTNTAVGDGTLGNAYSTISEALNNVTAATEVIRILGNGGTDGDLRTTDDSNNYLIGYDDDFNVLADGESIIVPQGVTVVIDQGAVIKLQNTVIDVGSSSTLEDRSNAALQILGTPDAQVVLTAYGNDAVGGDDDGPSDGANPGDWGGIIFRADSDYEDDSVFLNYIAHADISYGGGQVYLGSVLQTVAPIHIDEARPTLAYNTITYSANAAISADPNSFDVTLMKGGDFNHDQTLKRIGPDIYGNTIIDNSLNGLFIRTETLFGQDIDKVNVTARFDDTDIVHIITENLFIEAGTGGPVATGSGLQARYSGSVVFDAGMVVKLGGSRIQTGRGNAGIIAEGTEEAPVIFTSLFDDRYGAGGTFDTTNNDIQGANEREAQAGDWGGIILNQTSHGSIDHAIIAYGGGTVPLEGFSDSFNAIEVHQADLRVSNTLFESNAGVASSTDRNGLGRNEATTIFVRGAQPIIVNNRFVNNGGSVVDINANSLKSDILDDYGRSTGLNDAFDYLDGNAGPLVRLNRFENNGTNGMVVRGELLTVESVWDDTDIDHVLYDTITVDNFHTYGGLRLQSSTNASLVVKLGSGAGFTATGHGLDINDRIGGIVQIMGDPQNPVVLTSIFDDTIGSGIGLDGYSVTETVTGVSTAPAAGDWTGLQFLQMSHDRNVAIYNENELAVLDGNGDVNGIIRKAQFLGELAPDEKSGDENRRLGFEVHGSIASNNSGDADIYSFNAEAGTQIWIDIDRTGLALDTVIELLDPLGRVIAVANNNTDATRGTAPSAATITPNPLIENPNFGGDFYSSNPNDAGMRIVLPGMDGILTTYFVRVRSNSANLSDIKGGESNGEYQLQIRLRQVDEEPGSTVRYSDIRYATDAIYLAGLPAHSPLINETVESGDANPGLATQNLGNLLTSDRNTIGVSGTLSSEGDIDFYQFDITIEDIQSIAGVNAGGKTWATVFDIDYADGLGRADTTLSVFDSSGRLIFVSRESNVEDDQPGIGEGADADDITRGSFGTQDPYIGSVHLPEAGTYYVAVSSNTRLATALEATYNGSNSNALVRLEPINSLQRIVEDHIGSQGYSSNGVDIEPDTPLFDITDDPSEGISTHVTGFELSDVVLFTTNGHNLATVDPQQGVYETNIGDIGGISTTNSSLQITDLVMRSDGILYGIQNNRFIRIDTAGSYSGSTPVTSRQNVGTTNIPTISGNQVVPTSYDENSFQNLNRQLSLFNTAGTGANDVSIQAMTFARVNTQSGAPVYELYYVVTETGIDGSGTSRTFQKLYQADPNSGAILGNSEIGTSDILQNGFRGYLLAENVTAARVTASGTDNNTTPRSGTLYFQSVVPGQDGEGVQIKFRHGTTNDIDVNLGAALITITLDGDNSGSSSWDFGDIVSQINNDTNARRLVKAGMTGNTATNGYQALNPSSGTDIDIFTDNGEGAPDFSGQGLIQGIAFNNFHVDTNGGTQLIGVTSTGKVLDISLLSHSAVTNSAFTGQGLISSELADHGAMNFTGAALGPQNLFDGAYSDYVFATTNNGTLVALDSTGALMNVFGDEVTTANSGANTAQLDVSLDTTVASTTSNIDNDESPTQVEGTIQGLAFSPLDFNLWHTTRTQGTEAGHGINAAPDNSRVPSEIDLQLAKLADDQHSFNQSNGALSFYFGLEQFTTGDNTYLSYETASAQLGILDADFLRDLTSNSTTNIGNNVNLPGGAVGSLTTNTFSLAGYAAKDAPTIYFNYFLDTESTNSSTSNKMRDSARVYLQDDSGVWHLIATNNSTKSTSSNDWELPTYITHTASENTNAADTGRDYVQELFDSTGVWRQARIDLSAFAGQSFLKLRFDYSTAGSIGEHGDFDSDIHGDVDSAFNSKRRGQNNTGEGFYIDDIIVGFAERGEMVTNAGTLVSSFFDVYGAGNNEPGDAADQILTGSYNLEIRRATEYAVLVSPTDPFIAIATLFDTNDRLVEEDGLLGDDNFRREQGMVLIEGNQILSSQNGIVVETVRGDVFEGWFPHQGGTRALPNLNTQQLAPGAVLQNNLIVNSTFSGIDITGDIISPESVIPVVKVVNNTIYGGLQGINVFTRVSPTIVNNIVANTVSGISVLTSGGATVVVDANLFQGNLVNGTMGTNWIDLLDTEALFVDAAAGNFYLADNSKAIDSSLNRLADRPLYTAVKTPLGIPASDVFAPSYDTYGQLRVDDPTQSPPPGLGSNVFKDRGAIERADFVGPTATITLPPDNDVNDLDLDPVATQVYVANPELFTSMIVELRDTGIGIDDAQINSSQFILTAQTSTGTTLLEEGTHYLFSYNSNTNEAIFSAVAGVFELDTRYTITVDNSAATGITDRAGNLLQPNQIDSSTSFSIVVTDGTNDPPVNNFNATPIPDSPNTAVSTESETPLIFSTANGNALTVTDPDAFLGDGLVSVTLTAVNGTLTLGTTANVLMTTGNGLGNETTFTFQGLIANVNAALEGTIWTPDIGYYSSIGTPATLTMTTSDLTNFDGPAELDTDVIDITVNDPPTVQFSSATYSVTETDQGTLTTLNVTLTRDKIGAASTVLISDSGTGSATSGVDYNAIIANTPVTFTANQTTATFTITIIGDDVVEFNETIDLAITGVFFNAIIDPLAQNSAEVTINDNDQAILNINTVTQQENEDTGDGAGVYRFTASLSNLVDASVSVDATTQDGSAYVIGGAGTGVGNDDYTLFDNTITINQLTSSIDFLVNVTTDTIVELDEYFDVIMSSLSASGLNVILGTNGRGNIINDDQAILSISGQDVVETDNGSTTTMTFTLALDHQVAGAIGITAATQDLEATVVDNDYNPSSDTISFAAGSTSETFTVTINGDDKVELNERLTVLLSNLLNNQNFDVELAGGGLTTSATGTILNDDQALFNIQDVSRNEEAGLIIFTVEMTREVDTAVSINVNTADGTALSNAFSGFVSDNDYTPVSNHQLLFNSGERFKTFTVFINNDNVVELDEEFTVSLDNTSLSDGGRDVVGTGSATGTILNTDTAQVNISRVSQTEEANGSVFRFTASLTAPVDTTITLTADAEGLSASELLAFPGLDAALADIDFLTSSSPYAITFNKEEQSFQFDVEVVNDSIVELNEVFKVSMDNLATNSRNVTSGAEGIGIIQNGLDAGVISITSASVNEGTPAPNTPPGYTSLTFNVNLSAGISKNVSFTVSTGDGINLPGSAIGNATVADGDYLPVSPQEFTIAGTPASGTIPTSQTFTVLIAEDFKVERDEVFRVLLSQLNNAGLNVSLSPTIATGTIVNDDQATITINNVTQLESDGDMTFTATLSNPVDTDISVEIYTEAVSSLLDDNDYTAIAVDQPLILSFNATDPLTKNFTIHINNENVVEADEDFSVLFGTLLNMGRNVSTSPISGPNIAATGTILNDDSASLSITPVIGTENDSPFQFTVTLSNPVDIDITVDAATFNGTAVAPDDYFPFADTLTFIAGETQQTVDVNVRPDSTVESPETFDLTLSNLISSGRSVFLTSIHARSSSATTDAAVAVDVVGNYAYIADRDGGLQIFNISNPSSPVHVGAYDFNQQGIAQAIDVVGNLAYLAVGEAGLQIINISNPANPTFVGSIATPARARGVQVVGNLAYVADDSGNGGGLQIIDVTNPASPSILGNFGVSTPGGLAGGVEVIGNIAYLTDGNNGLHIVDVSNSANPTLIKSVATPGGAAIGLDVVGNLAYVANREGGVQVIDISDPFTAFYVRTLHTPGIATGVKVVGNFAYVTDGMAGLQVIDLTTGDIANTFDTPGSARSLFVSGTLAFVADTFSGLQILEFFPSTTATGTIIDPAGPPLTGTASPNTTISTSLVTAPTATNANGETETVPDSVDWIDEWDSFWVEVWGNTSDGSGISGGNFDLEYNTDYFTATAVEFGSAFGGSSAASIDDQAGIVSGISGQNSQGNLGGSGQVLLARVKFESIGEDNVAIDQVTGFLGPHNLGIRVVNASLDVTDFGDVTASTGETLDTELWAVPFDLNDDGTINYRDLITFTSYYDTSVVGAESGLAWSLDFDKSGKINYRDLIFLATNYNRSRGTGQQISFPTNFPQEWYGSPITTEGSDSLSTLIDAATDEWKTATGNPDLAVQVVVTDLGGQQLGEGHILELDENGIPVKGRVYIDDDAGGLGWYSSVDGLAFDSNGQAIAGSAAEGHYDLYTVLLHEIGHAAGFTTSYSPYTNQLQTSDSGQVQFVSWDFIAPLTDDGLHIDETFYPDDIMGATLDPSTRKMISTLDIQVLQAAYNNADGAVITPLSAPLMASSLVSLTTTESTPVSNPVAPRTQPVVAPEQQQIANKASSQSSGLQTGTAPAWYLAPELPLSSSSLIVEQSVDQDLQIGSLFEVSYETDLSDDLEPEETNLELSFNPEFDLDDVRDSEVADEELDSLFADWAGPLV